jgi:hypothetical protein
MNSNISEFEKFIKKGPENYFNTLKSVGALSILSEYYSDNTEQKIKDDFDEKGIFTMDVFAHNPLGDKYYDEEPIRSFEEICEKTFGNNNSEINITMIFNDRDKALFKK